MEIFKELSKLNPEREVFIQKDYLQSSEWKEVKKISDKVYSILSDPKMKRKIDKDNQPGGSSRVIQTLISTEMEKLGFTSEREGLFSEYRNTRLRPDFYKKVGDSGIIFEVERGKTNINNMDFLDFLDFWKCHICREVNYLFLFVPILLFQNTENRPSKPFHTTRDHISSFFEVENYNNVRGVVLYGY